MVACPYCFSHRVNQVDPLMSLCLECGCYIPHPLHQDFPNVVNIIRFPRGVRYSLQELLELEGYTAE